MSNFEQNEFDRVTKHLKPSLLLDMQYAAHANSDGLPAAIMTPTRAFCRTYPPSFRSNRLSNAYANFTNVFSEYLNCLYDIAECDEHGNWALMPEFRVKTPDVLEYFYALTSAALKMCSAFDAFINAAVDCGVDVSECRYIHQNKPYSELSPTEKEAWREQFRRKLSASLKMKPGASSCAAN